MSKGANGLKKARLNYLFLICDITQQKQFKVNEKGYII